MTKKIITIDKNTRIKIICGSKMLQYKKKSKKNKIAWIIGGHFSDWTSMAEYYINEAPYRTIEGTKSFEKLIKVVERSTDRISQILLNN